MERYVLAKALVGAMVGALAAGTLAAGEPEHVPGQQPETQNYHAVFSGFNELGEINAETGAILSQGAATLELQVDLQAQTVTYTMQFSGMSTPVTQAHLHLGKVHDAGGVMVFLCSNLGNGPAGTPACPAGSGTVTGTISAASVQAIPTQNVTAGDFDALVEALESNTTYANIHTQSFPAGEVRGQVERNRP